MSSKVKRWLPQSSIISLSDTFSRYFWHPLQKRKRRRHKLIVLQTNRSQSSSADGLIALMEVPGWRRGTGLSSQRLLWTRGSCGNVGCVKGRMKNMCAWIWRDLFFSRLSYKPPSLFAHIWPSCSLCWFFLSLNNLFWYHQLIKFAQMSHWKLQSKLDSQNVVFQSQSISTIAAQI